MCVNKGDTCGGPSRLAINKWGVRREAAKHAGTERAGVEGRRETAAVAGASARIMCNSIRGIYELSIHLLVRFESPVEKNWRFEVGC
jgi:hypothetical protein